MAWCLQLQVVAACRLLLVASGASGVLHNISDDTRSLVFRICNVVYIFIPALSTAGALIPLFLSRAGLTLPDHGRRVGPELDWRLVDHMRGHTND